MQSTVVYKHLAAGIEALTSTLDQEIMRADARYYSNREAVMASSVVGTLCSRCWKYNKNDEPLHCPTNSSASKLSSSAYRDFGFGLEVRADGESTVEK